MSYSPEDLAREIKESNPEYLGNIDISQITERLQALQALGVEDEDRLKQHLPLFFKFEITVEDLVKDSHLDSDNGETDDINGIVVHGLPEKYDRDDWS